MSRQESEERTSEAEWEKERVVLVCMYVHTNDVVEEGGKKTFRADHKSLVMSHNWGIHIVDEEGLSEDGDRRERVKKEPGSNLRERPLTL